MRVNGPLVLAGMILGTPMPTLADPVRTVTQGSYLVANGEDGEWTLEGSGFTIAGLGTGHILPFWDCLRCLPGSPVSLDAVLRLGAPHPNSGTATVDGVDYGWVFWNVDFRFDSGHAIAGAGVRASSPFTFVGSAFAFADESKTTPLFSLMLAGEGLANIAFFRHLDEGTAEVLRVSYDFAAADPVPEPASLLLVGSGLAAAFGVRRRRNGSH
jgi:hypothetical protein